MALPQFLRKSADKLFFEYCAERDCGCGQLHPGLSYRIGGNRVTLFEQQRRCPMQAPTRTRPVAQFRYQPELKQWSLHYRHNGVNWVFYPNCGPSLDLAKILRHVDADPLGMFWA